MFKESETARVASPCWNSAWPPFYLCSLPFPLSVSYLTEQIRIISPALFLIGGMSGPLKAPCLGSPQRIRSFFPLPVWETRAPNQYARALGPGDLGSDLDVLEALQGLESDEEAPLPIAEA